MLGYCMAASGGIWTYVDGKGADKRERAVPRQEREGAVGTGHVRVRFRCPKPSEPAATTGTILYEGLWLVASQSQSCRWTWCSCC